MKAIVYGRYGTPDVLRLEEVPTPVPKEGEVLVRMRASSVNASDWEFLTGSPAYVRAWGPLRPRHPILGSDVSGIVEAVGPGVTRLREGDAVLGDILGRWGTFAEQVCAPEEALLHKPAEMSFEDAATLPQAASVAVQALRDRGRVRPGQRVLVNGAGGGSGTFAVQIAKAMGAEVTGVDSAAKLDTMRSAGADHVLDYRREDLTRRGEAYDLIVDFVASHALLGYRRALGPGGRYLLVGGSVPHILRTLTAGPLLSLLGSRKLGMLAARPNAGLDFVLERIAQGEVTPVIDARYPLRETADALRHLGEGRARGKVVVTM